MGTENCYGFVGDIHSAAFGKFKHIFLFAFTKRIERCDGMQKQVLALRILYEYIQP